MGGGAAVFEWQGRNVWRVVCWRDSDACGGCASAAFGGDLSGGDSEQLSRELDLPGWGIRAVVQRIVDFGAGGEHVRPDCGTKHECDERNLEAAATGLSAV